MVCTKMCWRVVPPGRRRFPLTTLSTVIIIIIIGLDRPDWSRTPPCAKVDARSRLIVDGRANGSQTRCFRRRLNRVSWCGRVTAVLLNHNSVIYLKPSFQYTVNRVPCICLDILIGWTMWLIVGVTWFFFMVFFMSLLMLPQSWIWFNFSPCGTSVVLVYI